MRRLAFSAWLGLVLLATCGAAADEAGNVSSTAQTKKPPIRVAVFADKGTGSSVTVLVGILNRMPEMKAERIMGEEIRAGKLREFDVLLHPGGGGRAQGNALGVAGREEVRRFVHAGGGYLGICAGAYLATAEVDAYLGILDADVVDFEHWARGTGDVEVSLTAQGKKLLGADAERLTIHYAQGPLLAPAGNPALPDYQLLAKFETEIALKGAPQGVMIGASAIVASQYGQGRIICFSPHPEKTEGLRGFVQRGALWAAGQLPQAE